MVLPRAGRHARAVMPPAPPPRRPRALRRFELQRRPARSRSSLLEQAGAHLLPDGAGGWVVDWAAVAIGRRRRAPAASGNRAPHSAAAPVSSRAFHFRRLREEAGLPHLLLQLAPASRSSAGSRCRAGRPPRSPPIVTRWCSSRCSRPNFTSAAMWSSAHEHLVVISYDGPGWLRRHSLHVQHALHRRVVVGRVGAALAARAAPGRPAAGKVNGTASSRRSSHRDGRARDGRCVGC